MEGKRGGRMDFIAINFCRSLAQSVSCSLTKELVHINRYFNTLTSRQWPDLELSNQNSCSLNCEMILYAFLLYFAISARLVHPIYYALQFGSWSMDAKEHNHPIMPSYVVHEILLKMRRLPHNRLQSSTRAQGAQLRRSVNYWSFYSCWSRYILR
jgi:hypothetical protein